MEGNALVGMAYWSLGLKHHLWRIFRCHYIFAFPQACTILRPDIFGIYLLDATPNFNILPKPWVKYCVSLD